MTTRRVAQIGVIGLFVFAALFVAWGLWHMNRHHALLDELAREGIDVTGTVVELSRSEPSASSSASISFVVEVEHRFDGRSYRNPYAISRREFESLRPGDRLDVTLLPEEPGVAQLTRDVRSDERPRRFIPVDR